MAVHAQWHDAQHTVVRQVFDGEWSWEEWAEADRQTQTLLSTVEHPVSLVVDLRANSRMPGGFMANAPSVATSPVVTSPQVERIIIVGATQTYTVMGEFFKKVFPNVAGKLVFFDTLEEVDGFLADEKP